MPVFPAVKGGDMMVGVDVHKVYGVPVHPYNGTITVHTTPKFPMCNVTVNSMPACTIGASSVMPHVPQGTPIDPSNFLYGKKDKVNTKMMQELLKHTIDSRKTILNLKAITLRDKSSEKFVQKATGLTTKEDAKTWEKIRSDFSRSSKSNTWKALNVPPTPYPGGQGCIIAGSSKVTVNGAPMAYVFPMNAASCTDIQNVPNASVMGVSNVFVGVTYTDMMKAAQDNEVEEKQDFTLRIDMSEDMAKLSKAKVTLTNDKGFRQQKSVASDWKKKNDEYGDILFKDLPINDDPEKNPKYTLEIDYGCVGKPSIVFKDKVYGSWITESASTPLEQKDT
jgi:hypothetical protein